VTWHSPERADADVISLAANSMASWSSKEGMCGGDSALYTGRWGPPSTLS